MTDMLIRNNAQVRHSPKSWATTGGADAATALHRRRQHPEAVFRAYYTQLNADLQQRAIALGGAVTYLEDEEARLYDETNRGVLGRPWDLWKARFAPKEHG